MVFNKNLSKPKWAFCFFQDVTEEKRHEKQRDILLEASRLINSSIKIDTLTLKIIELFAKYLEIDSNDIKLFSVNENELNLISPQNENESINKISLNKRKLAIVEAVNSSSIIASVDLSRSVLFEKTPDKIISSRKRNVVAFPIKIDKTIIAAIELLPFGSKDKIEREISFLTLLANEFALGLNRLQLNEELRVKNIDLEMKTDELQTAHQTLKRFLAFFSHELRSPLTSILGFSELISTEENLTEIQARDYSTRIYENGKHLLNLINDILDLSRLEAGKLELHFTQIDARKFFDSLLASFKPQCDLRNLSFTLKIDEEIETIIADEVRLKQIFVNLISNAIKFSYDNTSILIIASREKNNFIFKIKDTGIGISRSDIQKLFSPFYQTQSSTQKNMGSGLGLSITKKLVELHQGEISVLSEAQKGSTFIVELPLMVQASQEGIETLNALKATIAQPPKQTKILIVEDKEHARELLVKIFTDAGYIIDVASSGVEAIEKAKLWKPDVITLDILLPMKDGWQVMRELKEHPICKNIPIIIISMIDERKLGFGLGAAEYFVKPIKKEVLLDSVRSIATKYSLQQKSARILVIDDDQSSTDLIKIILEAEGCTIFVAHNGKDGLRLANEHRPDLIILDLIMPGGMSGFDVAHELKHQGATVNIPIIVMTGMEIDDETRSQLEGFVVSLMKKSGFTKKIC